MARAVGHAGWFGCFLIALWLSYVGIAAGQPPTPPAFEGPPEIVAALTTDPADPERYVPLFGRALEESIAVYRDGRRLRIGGLPYPLQRGDELETSKAVVAVLRYPAGDVYVAEVSQVRVGSLDVLFGKVFARVRGLFSVESQNVVAGVEGTEFAFEVGTNAAVNVTVLDGSVACSSKAQAWSRVRLGRNQVFESKSANQTPLVRPASLGEVAQLRSWVRRVDVVVAPSAPPPIPPPQQPPPEPPQPPPVPPMPAGYCCDGGQLFPSTVGECRGTFYYDQSTANARCFGTAPPPQPPPIPIPIPVPVPIPEPQAPQGYCCVNGEVFAAYRDRCRGSFYFDPVVARRSCGVQTQGYCCFNGDVFASSRDRCRGNFYLDQRTARAECRPPPTNGYCCLNGDVFASPRDRCSGSFFVDQAAARANCKSPPPPPTPGYCCVGGQISPSDRAQCRGNFFADIAAARANCKPPQPPPSPQQGYCCVGGKVSQSTKDRCSGTFAATQQEAQRACVRIADTIKDKPPIVTKPPEGPVVR